MRAQARAQTFQKQAYVPPQSNDDFSQVLCNTLQHAATSCNTLQHTAVHCNTLQHTATRCNTLQHTATHCNEID